LRIHISEGQIYDHYDYVSGGEVHASLDVDSEIHLNIQTLPLFQVHF
jgi:hypothetical protein